MDEELLAEIAKREADEQATAATEAPKPNGKKKNGKSHVRIVEPGEGPPLFDDREPTWQDNLKRGKYGITKSIANIELILTEHDQWKGTIVRDLFASRTLAVKTEDGRVPPCTETGHWRDVDTTRVQVWIAQNYNLEVGHETIDRVVENIAHKQGRHPVREYLDGLKWDGVQRLPKMLHKFFGCDDTYYYEQIGIMWMISAIARVRQPGCQADYVLVLVSPEQGLRKSTAIRILGKGWGADTPVSIGDNFSLEALQGVWVLEIAELAALRGARDIEAVKAFVTSRCDHFRAPYERRTKDWPRQCVFAASTNDHDCLNDPSGNRRFWPADCGMIDIDGLKANIDQLWAEADSRYASNEPWYPTTRELHAELVAVQADHTQQDSWLQMVQEWLNDPYRTIGVRPEDKVRVYIENGITTAEALRGAISVTPERCDGKATTHMGKVLRECGLVPRMVRVATTGKCSRVRKYFVPTELVTGVTPGDAPPVTEESSQLSLMSQVSQVSHHSPVYTHERFDGNSDNVGEWQNSNHVKVSGVGCDGVTGVTDQTGANPAPQPDTQADDGPVLFETCRTCNQSETFCFCSGGFSPKENHGPGRIEI